MLRLGRHRSIFIPNSSLRASLHVQGQEDHHIRKNTTGIGGSQMPN
jgi:hypothetical protein